MGTSKQSREVNSRNFDILFAGIGGIAPLAQQQTAAPNAFLESPDPQVPQPKPSAPAPKPHVPLRPAPSFTPVITTNPAPPMPQIGPPPVIVDKPTTPEPVEAKTDDPAQQDPTPPAPERVEVTADVEAIGAITLDDGTSHNVTQKTTLGRNPAAPTSERLVVTDPRRTMSKSHLQVRAAKGGVTIVDLNSTNGTHVVSSAGISIKLRPNNPTFVELGSTVHFGGRSFTVTPGKETN